MSDENIQRGQDGRFSEEDKKFLRDSNVPFEIANEYDHGFDGSNIGYLFRAGIFPEVANEYYERFNCIDMVQLKIRGASFEEASKYDEKFSGKDISFFIEKNYSSEQINGFDGRFDINWDLDFFIENGVLPNEANKFSKDFEVEDIKWYIENGVSAEEANACRHRLDRNNLESLIGKGVPIKGALKYNKRFSESDINDFFDRGISAEEANAYKRCFNDVDIICLAENLISPEEANRYNKFCFLDSKGDLESLVGLSNQSKLKIEFPFFRKRFNHDEIIEFISKGISAKEAINYFRKFKKDGVAWLIERDISVKEAKKYGKRFGGGLISHFVENGISPDEANRYDKRFNEWGINLLVKARVSAEEADKYDERFDGTDISRLVRSGVSAEEADKYDERFKGDEVVDLIKVGVSAEEADKYDERFKGYSISELIKEKINIEGFEKYGERFKGGEIVSLIEAGVSPEEAEKYDEKFKGYDIADLVKAGCSAEQAKKYNYKKSHGLGIARLAKAKVSPDEVEKYDENLDYMDIVSLVESGLSEEDIKKYPRRFLSGLSGVKEVIELINAGVSPDEAKKYSNKLSGLEVALFYTLGVEPKGISLIGNIPTREKNLIRLLKSLTSYDEVAEKPKDYTLIGAGCYSIVLLKDGKAWKFSEKIRKEYDILKKIHEENNGEQKNVIKLLDDLKKRVWVPNEHEEDMAIEIEYIKGDSLENVIKKGALPVEKALKYSTGVAKGICEIRKAGIYHRDLHDRNILIDEEKDNAVIIDLGEATENPTKIHNKNRSYGGNNDLISLGQLTYKMVTGHNLFDEGPGFSGYSAVKNDIKTKREKTYDNPNKLKKCLEKVRQDVNGELGEIIVYLLNDNLWEQPYIERVHKAKKMFKQYQQSQSNQ